MNKKKIRNLCSKIVTAFGAENVVCILFHGSIVFNPEIQPQDVDLVIILKQKKEDDCMVLRRLVKGSRLFQLPVHLHLIYLEEIPANADFFSIHTCGAFFVCHLRQAETLYGENVFDKMTGPSDYHLQLSLLQKAQQYTFQLRNLIFKTEHVLETELLWARKKSVIMLKDLLLSSGTLIQEEERIIQETIRRFPQFSTEEIAFFREILKPWIIPRTEAQKRRFLVLCLSVHECVYGVMRARMASEEKCRFLG